MTRYLTAAIEQALWSILNLGVNLLLLRVATPDQYGTFAFWANVGFVFVSLQNALTVTHLSVLPPGDDLHEDRLPTERIMHGVTGIFLILTACGVLGATLFLKGAGQELGAPMAALFVPAFLMQQYFRFLSFSRGRPNEALAQTLAVLVSAVLLLVVGSMTTGSLTADHILGLLGLSYGAVGLVAGVLAVRRQGLSFSPSVLSGFHGFLKPTGWLFLGVTSSELLTRFYAFAVAGAFGASALASLSATQLLLRPIPLLATSWSQVARVDLIRRKESRQWRAFSWMVVTALIGGLIASAIWSGAIDLTWPWLSQLAFKGKYLEDRWMVMLWGVSAALSLVQVVINTPLQVLQDYRALAIANAVASVVSAAGILIGMRMIGPGGAIIGTSIGQLVEVLIMGGLLVTAIRSAQNQGR
ncbi:MAG: hypothetical protein CFE28_14250 [Alphaproteobacteria bacterium PA2]|nr:MAG: hypothetical protein CFE28_14250 [Alphaproteobacteria bacterium PA2]